MSTVQDSKMEETVAPISQSPSKSPKSSPSKKDIDIATQALNHFAQGKRHLLVNDITSAVNSLQEACGLLAKHYGETASECADAYYYYGRALLEMARIENGVLGNALDGVPEGSDAENSQIEDPENMTEGERDMVSEAVGEALEENFIEIEKKVNGEKKVSTVGLKVDAEEMELSEIKSSVTLNGTKQATEKMDIEEEGTQNISDKAEKDKASEKVEDKASEKVEDKASEKVEDKASEKVEDKASEKVAVKPDSNCLDKSDDNKENKDIEKNSLNKSEEKSILKETSNHIDKKEKTQLKSSDKEEMEVDAVAKNEDGSTESEEDKEQDEDDDADEKPEGDELEGDEAEEEGEENSQEPEGDQTEEDDDVSNLQLSWEMFELSKVIFSKQVPVNQKKLAQAYLKLGEVGLESENYTQSIEDFTSCLEIQKEALPSDDRCLAETYYQLGVAHSFSDDFDKAIDNFGAAAKVIESRISNLKDKIKEKESWTEEQKLKAVTELEDPFYTEQGEIDELDKLLPEIKEKLVDMEEMKKDSKEKLQKVKEATFASVLGGSKGASTSSNGVASTSTEGFSSPFSGAADESVNKIETKPASNISHLIRKKRKPEEEVSKDDLKKAKGEDGEPQQTLSVNGSLTNGDTSPQKMETESVSVTKEAITTEVSDSSKEESASTA